jgi:hypothetical protein
LLATSPFWTSSYVAFKDLQQGSGNLNRQS